jgi:hypothetical protein
MSNKWGVPTQTRSKYPVVWYLYLIPGCGGLMWTFLADSKIIMNKLNNMNEILNDLHKAIDSIEEFYYTIPNVKVINDKISLNDNEFKFYERRFAAQLKSEYDRLIRNGITGTYKEVRTDLEVIKKYIFTSHLDHKIKNSFSKLYNKDSDKTFETITTIPDFFIHKQQDNFDEDFQKLIVEIKTTPNLNETDLFFDLFKLNIYVEKYKFQNGVLLIVNNELNKIEKFTKSYLNQKYYIAPKNHDRIYLFVKENFTTPTILIKLDDLVFSSK